MAKAPVPGQVKTRLGAVVGHEFAARLATACILDTLDVCEAVFADRGDRHLALAGALDSGRHRHLRERLRGWTVHPQRGAGFAGRLAQAHVDVAYDVQVPVVQIGMDTPHLSADDLTEVTMRLGRDNDAVLGPADDGGWWVLALADPRLAESLRAVEMSTERTYADTRNALESAGARVADAATLRDVDTRQDAEHAAAAAPGTRFAWQWRQRSGG